MCGKGFKIWILTTVLLLPASVVEAEAEDVESDVNNTKTVNTTMQLTDATQKAVTEGDDEVKISEMNTEEVEETNTIETEVTNTAKLETTKAARVEATVEQKMGSDAALAVSGGYNNLSTSEIPTKSTVHASNADTLKKVLQRRWIENLKAFRTEMNGRNE